MLKISKVDAATHPVLEVLGMLAGAGALVLGMVWVTQRQGGRPGVPAAAGAAGGRGRGRTQDQRHLEPKIQQANAAAERVFDILDQPLEPEKPDAIALPPVRRRHRVPERRVHLPRHQRPTLDGISLTIKAGLNVAIVGANGSGKTTLANLLPRLLRPGQRPRS